MKTSIFNQIRLWLPIVCATMMLTACSNDDSSPQPSPEPEVKTIFYTASVGDPTRATVESDNRTIYFADGDKLYVQGTNISGILDIQTGAGTANATFSGTLTYSGSGSPADNLALNATLVGTSNVGVQINAQDIVTGIDYGTDLVLPNGTSSAVNEAVKKYSYLTGTNTFGAHSFTLTQHTTFLNFTIIVPGTASGTSCPVSVNNVGGSTRTGNVTSVTSGSDVVLKFVAPVAPQTLSNASVMVKNQYGIPFGGKADLSPKVYNVTKTIDANHEYVDLGLSVKWAKTNLGAMADTEPGNYYAWGGTAGYSLTSTYTFTQDNAPYYENSAYTKYNTTEETTLVSTDDAATVSRGAGWRMPTKAEFEELKANSTIEYKYGYGGTEVNGYLFTSTKTGYTDKSIFLPATGKKIESTAEGTAGDFFNKDGSYWLSTHYTTVDGAWCIGFAEYYDAYSLPTSKGLTRYYGFTIRPVYKP